MAPKIAWMRAFWLTLHGDPMVQALDDQGFRCFARIMAATWQTQSPGVLTEKLARAWAYLGVEVTDEQWAAMRAKIEGCFLIDTRDLWVHRRSADEFDRLNDQRERLRAFHQRKVKLVQGVTRTTKQQTVVEPGTVETLFGPVLDDRREPAEGGCTRDEWEEGFDHWFWPSYPRKVAKQMARRAWMKIRPWTQETFNAILAGLERQATKMKVRVETGDSEFVPHAASWLNGRRWEDTDAAQSA